MADQGTSTGSSAAGGTSAKKAPTRPPAEIEAEIVATRERLVGTIAELEDYVHPKNVADRGKRKLQAVYTDDGNNVRWDRVAMTAGAVVGGLIALRFTTKTLRWALGADRRRDAEIVYLPVARSQVGSLTAGIGA
ncbi:MAG: DUF3618 domain-containing protein [Candidatus Nanopelagicales bacterium]|jgi:hypothetical protein|nr:DUF3618 domain-containing protein [Candidatus Nanopelagicales bacterium]